jgi:hypothetical protein
VPHPAAATSSRWNESCVVSHALDPARRPDATVDWDRWIAAGFAVGAACFFIGPVPGFVQLVGGGADAALFFGGSIFFTCAAALELREGTLRAQRRFADAAWWSAAIQFTGTLLFNVSTFNAMDSALSTSQVNRLVWAPDLFGSIAFLVSGALAYGATTGPHMLPARWLPRQKDPASAMALVNLAGCVLFGIAAIASYIVPSTGSVLALAPANLGTSLGGLCFLVGAVLLWRRASPAGTPAPA